MKTVHLLLLALGLALLLLLPACVHQNPVAQYPQSPSFAIAYVYDDAESLTCLALKPSTIDTLQNVSSSRQLKAQSVGLEEYHSAFSDIQDSERRIQSLMGMRPDAEVAVLVEFRSQFYSQLSGRYRWDVRVNIELYEPSTQLRMQDTFNVPAVLMYAHEKGDLAIDAVKDEVARKLGSLLDKFMKGRSADSAPPRKASKPSTGIESPLTEGQAHARAIYFIMVDRFFRTQPPLEGAEFADFMSWHGGDLGGVQAKLDYIKGMGITDIWLSPVFLSDHEEFMGHHAFHGYWTYDLREIDPQFGGEEALRALATAAKERDIGIILDFVANHVAYTSPWVDEKPGWFNEAFSITNWDDPYELENGQVHGLPDLNQNNPEVARYLIDAAEQWLEIPNIVGYRLDAVKHVPQSFWKRLNRAVLAKNPRAVLLGEYFDGSPANLARVLNEAEFTQVFDFPLAFALRNVFCKNQSLAELGSVLEKDALFKPEQLVTFVDNHDISRIMSECAGRRDRVENAITAQMLMRGVPSIYYGTESLKTGELEIDNRSVMDFNDTPLYAHIQTALKRRAETPLWMRGQTSVLHYEKDLLVVLREDAAQQALVIFNQKAQSHAYRLPAGAWNDALHGGAERSDALKIPAKSIAAVIRKKEKSLRHTAPVHTRFQLPNDGQNYAIVGSLETFGNWNPALAIRTEGASSLELKLPAQSVITFKLVTIGADGQYQWESGDNREIFTEDYRDRAYSLAP